MVVVKEIDEKGKGLVATRKIPAGTVIFAEDPLFEIHTSEANMKVQEEFERFENLDENLKEEFLALFDPVGLELDESWEKSYNLDVRKKPQVTKFWRIYSANAIEVGFKFNNEQDDLSAVYKLFSRINHACSSNVNPDWKPENPLQIEIRAATTIKKGEELTVDYVGELLTWQERMVRLNQLKWSIRCQCRVCSLSEEERDRNNMLRNFIHFHLDVNVMEQCVTPLGLLKTLNEHLQALVACFSIEHEARIALPLLLGRCSFMYLVVKSLGNRISWGCPTDVKTKLVERLGPNFLESLKSETRARAEVLGRGMVEIVKDRYDC